MIIIDLLYYMKYEITMIIAVTRKSVFFIGIKSKSFAKSLDLSIKTVNFD